MAQVWWFLLLLGSLSALSRGQIVYPDQYEMMKTSMNLPNLDGTSRYVSTVSNGQAAQRYPVAADAAAPERERTLYSTIIPAAKYHPLTTPAAYYPTVAPAAYYPPSEPPVRPRPLPQTWGDRVNDIIAKGVMRFSLDLDRAIYNTKGTTMSRDNAIFSPLNIGVALSLILAGSAGTTFDEVARVLGLETGVDISQQSEIVHQMFGLLLAVVNYRVEGSNMPRVSSASGIFVQEGYPIRTEFEALSRNVYESEVINLDFQRRGKEAQDAINNWVNQRTMGKISSILSEEPSQLTNVILLSALYFSGEWNQHFLENTTNRRQFFIEPNEAIEVDMMYNGGNFPFYYDKSLGVKIVALPYKGLEMSMYVLLPKAEGAAALKNFRDNLTTEIIEYLIGNLTNQTCIIGLPRMKLSSTLKLNEALKSMGLRSLFDPRTADLSVLSSGHGSRPSAAARRGFATPQAASPLPTALPPSIPRVPQAASPTRAKPTGNVDYYPSYAVPQAASPIPTALPSSIPRVPQTTSPTGTRPADNNDYLIFSRVSEDHGDQRATTNARNNRFRYEDKQRGVVVEQWGTGFQLSKIRRALRRRDTVDGRNDDASRATYVTTKNGELARGGHESTKYVSLEENKYRFRDLAERRASREKRQIRPMDENFLSFIRSQNFTSYGLDAQRNSGGLVNPHLFADEIVHKVEMEVTERGTEAAAATAVILHRDGNQKRLMADRPFLFFIRHDPTKLILFWGTVNTPTPNYTAR